MVTPKLDFAKSPLAKPTCRVAPRARLEAPMPTPTRALVYRKGQREVLPQDGHWPFCSPETSAPVTPCSAGTPLHPLQVLARQAPYGSP